jgi:hypothetical protein
LIVTGVPAPLEPLDVLEFVAPDDPASDEPPLPEDEEVELDPQATTASETAATSASAPIRRRFKVGLLHWVA